MELRAGDPGIIGGYVLEERLGSGGMGTVFLTRSPSGRSLAIKLIHPQFLDDDEFRTRFRQEVAAARRVSGAFTAAVVDADPDGDHPWMATAYIPGPTLAERIADDGALSGAELRTLAIGLVEALRDIHRAGVVHRDLKPSNVVLSPDGPRVIDFGISRATDQKTLTMTGRIIGTPPFMSPEQLQTPREVGTASDVFSVATLLVYAATGQGPFDADSPYMTAYQVVHEQPELGEMPRALRAVVEPCLAKDRTRRPDADELLRQLRALPENLPPEGRSAEQDPEPERAADPGPAPGGAGPTTRLRPQRSDAGQASAPTPAATSGSAPARTPDSASASTPASASARTPDSGSTPSARAAARGLRRRWRTVVAVTAAVAAIGTGFTLLGAGRGKEGPADAARPAPTATGHLDQGAGAAVSSPAPVPQGFRPWEVTLHGGREITDEVRCLPDGDSVYCGGGGVLAARIRTADGTQVWRRTSPGVPVQGVHLAGIADGTVLGYRIPESLYPMEIVALAAEDGRQLWSAPLGDRSAVLTGVTQDAVLLGSAVLTTDLARTRVEAREVRTGRVRWTARFPAGSECVPTVAGSRAYAVCAPRAETADARVAHTSFWTLDARTGALGDPVRVAGLLRPMGADGSGALIALVEHRTGENIDGYARVVRVDPRTGRATSSPLKRRPGATPGLAGGRLYFAGTDGEMTAVDPATGRQLWSTQTTVEGASAPVLKYGVLYFGTASGRVVALGERDGRVRWSTYPRTAPDGGGTAGVQSRVAVAGGVVVGAAQGNTVFGFDAKKPPKAS